MNLTFFCRKFVIVDFNTNFAALSIYNTNDSIFEQVKENSDIYIVDPIIKTCSLTNTEDKENNQLCQHKSIQLFEIDKLFVDQSKVTNLFAPQTVVSHTFAN